MSYFKEINSMVTTISNQRVMGHHSSKSVFVLSYIRHCCPGVEANPKPFVIGLLMTLTSNEHVGFTTFIRLNRYPESAQTLQSLEK